MYSQIKALIILFLLHVALGMVSREWLGAGLPLTGSYLMLFLLAPSLLLFDGVLIYGAIKSRSKISLIYILIGLVCFIAGVIIGWPKK